MHFRFDIIKATEVACDMIRREGGAMNIMKLVKLVYALDRLSIQRRGIPVVGGTYFSLPNGPITSELLDLINSGSLWGDDKCRWEEFVSDRQDHEVGLRNKGPGTEHLAPSELKLIDEVYAEHGAKSQWELRDWSHAHCEEWTPLEGGRNRIDLADLARAVGLNEERIRQIEQDAAEWNFVSEALHG
jgi:uncharacterized phage-associated protein